MVWGYGGMDGILIDMRLKMIQKENRLFLL